MINIKNDDRFTSGLFITVSSLWEDFDICSSEVVLFFNFFFDYLDNIFFFFSFVELTLSCTLFMLCYLLIYSLVPRALKYVPPVKRPFYDYATCFEDHVANAHADHAAESSRFKKITIFNTLFFTLLGCSSLFMVYLFTSVNLIQAKSSYSFFIFDFYSNFIGHLIIVFFLISLQLSKNYSLSVENLGKVEYPLLLCFSLIFLLLLVAANDLMSLYLTLEGLSLTLYVLASYDIGSSGSIEASLKYFCLGAIASGFLGFGISLLYGNVGALNYNNILYFFSNTNVTLASDYPISLSLSFICFGFFFKLSIPPFHSWTPDVYEGSPTASTFFFASVVKFGVFCSFIRLTFTFNYALLENNNYLKIYFVCFSLVAILVGGLGALLQSKFKRFLGYTAINQMGFILLGVSCLSFYGFISALIHLVVYVLMNATVFWVLLNIKYNNRNLIYFSDLRFLFDSKPAISSLFCLTLFSMAGIPPTIGFYTKFLLLKAAIFAGFFVPVLLVLFINVVSIFYYIRLIKILIITKKKEVTGKVGPNYFFFYVLNRPDDRNFLNHLKNFFMFIGSLIFLSGFWLKKILMSDFFTCVMSNLWNCFKTLDFNQQVSSYEIFERSMQLFIALF